MVPFFFRNTSATTELHSINPTPHINNEPSSLSNELNDLIDAHLTTLTQEHVVVFDPSHSHYFSPSASLTPTIYRTPRTTTLQPQTVHYTPTTPHPPIRWQLYTTHTNPPNPNSNPNPEPNPNSNQRNTNSPPRRRRYLCYAVRKGRTRGIFHSWDECRLQVEGIAKASTTSTTRKPTSNPLTPRLPQNEHYS